jgi:hypothetical protein
LTGAVIYGLTYENVFPVISAIANSGNVTIPDLWNLSSFLVILFFALMALMLFYLIDRVGWQRKARD